MAEWISVKDRLPEKCQCVITYRKCSDDAAYMDCESYYGEWAFDPPFKVTHWMPLPEKPKEDA